MKQSFTKIWLLTVALMAAGTLSWADPQRQAHAPAVNETTLTTPAVSNAPQLQAALQSILDRLSAAAHRLHPNTRSVSWSIGIQVSPEINAYVKIAKGPQSAPAPGVKTEYIDEIKVTMGFLQMMFGQVTDDASFYRALEMVAGVLAHEIGHSIDHRNSRGGVTQHGEVMADGFAVAVLREAQFPRNALYQALQKVHELTKNASGAIRAAAMAFASTHPSDHFREIQAEIGIVMDRFTRGATPNAAVNGNREIILGEISLIANETHHQGPASMPTPATISKTLELLQGAFRRATGAGAVDATEETMNLFTHLFFRLFAQIAQQDQNISQTDKAAIFSFIQEVVQNGGLLAVQILEQANIQVQGKSSNHADFLRQAPFFQSPEYRSFLQASLGRYFLELQDNKLIPPARDGFLKLVNIFCSPNLFAQLVQEHLSQMPSEIAQNPAAIARLLSRIEEGLLNQAFDVPMARVYQNVLDHFTESQRTEFIFSFDRVAQEGESESIFLGRYRRHAESFLLRLGDAYKNIDAATTSRDQSEPRSAGLSWAKTHDHWNEISLTAHSIWENRGYYAALDLFQDRFLDMDWHLIFSAVGISDQEGRKKLNASLGEFLRSPHYLSLLTQSQRHTNLKYRGHSFLDQERANKNRKRFRWYNGEQWLSILGHDNPQMTTDQRKIAMDRVGIPFMRDNLGAFRVAYRAEAIRALNEIAAQKNEAPNVEEIKLALSHIPAAIGASEYKSPVYDLQIEAIRNLGLSTETTRALLNQLYIPRPGIAPPPGNKAERNGWAAVSEGRHNAHIYQALHEAGVVGSPIQFITQIAHESRGRHSMGAMDHFQIVHGLAQLLMQDVTKVSHPEGLLSFAQAVFGSASPQPYEAATTVTHDVTLLTSSILKRARELRLPSEQAHQLFVLLTNQSTCQATDAYFDEIIRPALASNPNLIDRETLQDYITEPSKRNNYQVNSRTTTKRIASGRIRAEIARQVIDRQIDEYFSKYHKKNLSQDFFVTYVRNELEKILALTEVGTARDDLIEHLAWRMQVQQPGLLREMESQKSTSWSFVNASQIHQASAVTELAGILNGQARHDAIEYFMRPQGPLPESVTKALAEATNKEFRYGSTEVPSDNIFIQRATGESIRTLEVTAHSSSPQERIPILMLLLRSGDGALMSSADFPKNVLRRYLGTKPDSVEERAFLAFLRTSPPEEVPFALAYRMAMQAEGEGLRYRPLFEVFTGVGIKAGQLAGIFRLLGPEATAELRGLQNNAMALSLHQITEIFRTTLTPEEYARIRRPVRILGSASMKTVVEVELTDGTRIATMVQRPNADAQIKMNLTRARALVAELRATGIAVPSFMDQIIDGTQAQMADEVRMTHEAGNTHMAAQMYQSLNQSMQSELKGWRFEVPVPVDGFTPRDHLLFMQYAQGTDLKHMQNPEARAHAGRMITQASLRGMFRHGLLNPDPHSGNYIIDEANKIIRPIDFGQLETYETAPIRDFIKRSLRGDDAYNLSQFLRSVQERNTNGILRFGMRLTANASSNQDPTLLRQEIDKALSRSTKADELLIGITEAFSHGEVPLAHRFSFGALKGLLILHESENISADEFAHVLATEVEWVLNNRGDTTILDHGLRLTQDTFNCIVGGLRKRLGN